MRTERVHFQNAAGHTLAARLELPASGEPTIYALFAHCFTCSKDLNAVVHISRALSARGIGVLRFDFTGIGDSEGDFADTDFTSEVSDLVAAAGFLSERYQAPRLLIGHSLGGAAVLAAAAAIPSAAAVVTIAAPYDPAHLRRLLGPSADEIEAKGRATVNIAGRDFTIGSGLLHDLEAQNPVETLRRLKAPLLIMHSPQDEYVGIENAGRIYQAASHPKSFISLDQADHLLSDPRDSRYAGDMIATWADRYLAFTEPPAPSIHTSQLLGSRAITWTGGSGFRTEISVNGFSLLADEPFALGGGNEGPNPYDYLLAALGACTGMTLQMYAKRKGWQLDEVAVGVSHDKVHESDCEECAEGNRRIDLFRRELELHGELDQAQRQRLLEIAEQCPVHKTLSQAARIETTLSRRQE